MTNLTREAVIETLVRNGVTDTTSSAEVRACLQRLRWHPGDIDRTLRLLDPGQEDRLTVHQTALHTLLRTDERLRPETLSSLLGIELDISSADIESSGYRAKPRVTVGRFFVIVVLGILLSAVIMLLLMWSMKTGIFHPTLWTY